MTANEKRAAVAAKYKTILGRNYYSQPKRDYCFRPYRDGKYYSDCSSSISYCYKEAGFGFGILNTVGMYQSKKLTAVPVTIKNGQIQNPELLRVGDMLLFAGSDSGRAYAGYVGHVEMVYMISGSSVTLCGHGSGCPSTKKMTTYCKSRYNSKSSTKLGHKGLIKVVRFIQDDDGGSAPMPAEEPQKPDTGVVSNGTVKITGKSVYVRTGPGTAYSTFKIAHKGERFEKLNADGWIAILFAGKVRWISEKYVNDGVCTGGTVNVRKGAGTSFGSVGTVRRGRKLEAVDCSGWTPVVIDGDVKWVSDKYIA